MSPGPKHVLYALPRLARLPYHVSTIVALAEAGARVTVVFCKSRTATGNVPATEGADVSDFLSWVDEFPLRHPELTFVEEHRKRSSIRSPEVIADRSRATPRTLRSYARYLRRFGHANAYTERWRSYLPPWQRRLVRLPPVRAVMKMEATFQRLTALEARIPPDPAVCAWIEENGVDVVVASPTNQRDSPEVEFVKAGNERGVPTVVSVLSWDALSTKGLIPCPPTMLLAWNRAHAADAVDIHGLAPESVVVTGSPFFDKWFRPDEHAAGRVEVLDALGLPAECRYVLYLGSSRMIAPNESWLVERLREALDRRPALAELELVVRPHPANEAMVRDVSRLPWVHVDPSGLPYSEVAQRHLAGVIRHAEAFVGVNTSAMIDAIVLGKPGFSILSEAYRQTHAEAPHFRHVLDAGALYLVDDADALAKRLEDVLEDHDPRATRRRRFVQDFVRPRGLDIAAGGAQAQAILMLAAGRTPAEIGDAMGALSSPRVPGDA